MKHKLGKQNSRQCFSHETNLIQLDVHKNGCCLRTWTSKDTESLQNQSVYRCPVLQEYLKQQLFIYCILHWSREKQQRKWEVFHPKKKTIGTTKKTREKGDKAEPDNLQFSHYLECKDQEHWFHILGQQAQLCCTALTNSRNT